ncbi:MAG: EAL domain-containing protein [Eubacterium sp.]
MTLSYQFADSALVLQVLLLLLYIFSRHLPTYQNLCFRRLLEFGCFTTFLDILTCTLDSNRAVTSLPLLHTFSVLFFLCFVGRVFMLYEFTLCFTGRKFRIPRWKDRLFCLPYFLYSVAVVTAPWTGFMYTYDYHGMFFRTDSYNMLYIIYGFYVLLSVVLVLIHWKHISRSQCTSFLAFCGILIAGGIVRFINDEALLMNLIYAIGVAFLYLTIQDPSRLLQGNNLYFNQAALTELIMDHIDRQKKMAFFCLNVNNYEEIKAARGVSRGDGKARPVENFLKTAAYSMLVFYLGNGHFVLCDQGEKSEAELRRAADRYINDSLETDDDLLTMKASTAYIPESLPKVNGELVGSAINYVFTEMEKQGRTSRIIADDQILQRIRRNSDVDEALERTIRDESILLYFQPIWSCREHAFTSAEVLARIDDQKLGFLMPGEFIENAERSGNIVQLDHLMYKKTCQFIQDHDLEQMGMEYLEVNLSPAYSSHGRLAEVLMETAKEFSVSMRSLNLEITESAASDTAQMHEHMKTLCDAGMSFSLDDYGTGFSNMMEIMKLPFEIIKIDKSIVWSYFRGENRYLKGIIQSFKEEGFHVLAEGVETEEMRDGLAEMGCDYEQGFLFSKPLPEDAFLEFIRAHQDKNKAQEDKPEK